MTHKTDRARPADPPGATAHPIRRTGTAWLVLGLILVGLNLRPALASVSPLLRELTRRLGLSPTLASALVAVPVLCFGVFPVLAPGLRRRFGEERVLLGGLVCLAAGLLLRALAPGLLLFPGTVLAAGAIAVMNVLPSSLIKRRLPHRAGLLLGVFLLCVNGGATLGAGLSAPLYDAVHGSLALALGLWAVPVAVAFLGWLPQAGRATRPEPAERERGGTLWRSPLAWQVTLFMGVQGLTYYATLSWLPNLFRDRGADAAHAGFLLSVVGIGSALMALTAPALAHWRVRQPLLVIGTVVLSAAGLAAAVYAPLGTETAWMAVLGLGQGAALSLALLFTIVRAADPRTSATLAAMASGIGFLLSSGGPFVVGLLRSASGGWALPIWLLLALTGLELVAGLLAARDRTTALPA